MIKNVSKTEGLSLSGNYLCTVEFDVGQGIISLGVSPFGDSRVGYISGGRFSGPRLNGVVLPGGGNWSRAEKLTSGEAVGTFDARAVWQTDDGAIIYLSYTGRSVVPDDVRAEFADPSAPPVDPARYYLRIAPVFESASPQYGWLNGVLAIGIGERTDFGVRHQIFQVN